MIEGRTSSVTTSIATHGGTAAARPLKERLEAFPTEQRPQIKALAAWPELADLALSFPGVLFALVTGYASRDRKERTIRALLEGAPLKQAAQMLGLPMWLRKLPAEAFSAPLAGAPQWTDLDTHVANLVPADPETARAWLAAVVIAAQSCDEDFALWTAGWAARHSRALAAAQGEASLRWLAAWAWHGGQRGTPGYRLLRRPWTAAIGHRRALDEMTVWRQRVALAILLEAGRNVPRPASGEALGLAFVALETAEDYIVEADLMDNCLDQFAERLTQGYSRVFAVRQNGRSVASLEIGLHDLEPSMPVIRQLRGPRNRRVAPSVWQAAYAWLGDQPPRPVSPERWRPSASGLRNAARTLWEPYLAVLESRGAADRFRAMTVGGSQARSAGEGRSATGRRTAAVRPAASANS